ncbi:NAD-dependent epimerase/dehydratase family protein [Brachybacterium huguangmaarense]
MRIVVVGATGNVGTALLRRLHAAEEVEGIVGVARRGPDRDGEPFDGVEWVRCDIGDEGAESRLADAFAGADAVVHLAWIIRPNRDLAHLRRTNVDGAGRVAAAAVAAGVPHLVVASSVGAYGSDADPAPDRRPRDESFPTHGVATSHYAAQKAEVERLLDRVEAEAPHLLVTRLRPGLIFQEEAGPEIRDYFLGSLAPRPLLRLLGRGVVPILPWPRGVTAQAVHADDIAEAYWQVVRHRAGGAFNVAADPVVGADLVATVLGASRILPLPIPLVRAAAALTYRLRLQPTDPGWIDMAVRVPVMDTSRIRETIGWAPRHDAIGTLAAVVGSLGDRGGLGNAGHRSRSPLE